MLTDAGPGLTRLRFLQRTAGIVAGGVGTTLLAGCGRATVAARPWNRLDVQPGHHWRLSQSILGDPNFRGEHVSGVQSVKITTNGYGWDASASLERARPIDFTRFILKIWLRIDARTAHHLREIRIEVGSGHTAFSSYASRSIVLYDGAAGYLTELVKPGEWFGFTLTPATLATQGPRPVDFRSVRDIRVLVADDSDGISTVYLGGAELVRREDTFPKGVVSLTFDDSLRSQVLLAKPVLDKHGFRGTAYVIHDLIGGDHYMTTTELESLSASGWDVSLHADWIADHNAPEGFVSESSRRIVLDIDSEKTWLRRLGTAGREELAYPQGKFDQRVVDAIHPLVRSARTTAFRSVETLPVADWLRLRCTSYDRTMRIGPADVAGTIHWYVDQVSRFGGWLILNFHEIAAAKPTGDAIGLADLRSIVDFVAESGVPVLTVSAVRRAVQRGP